MLKDTSLLANFQQTFYIFTDMNRNKTYAIGLMSGTSLDGLDLVYVKLMYRSTYRFEILCQETMQYSEEWQKKLQYGSELESQYLKQLDIAYGIFLGDQVNAFIKKNQIDKVDFIASHGHTVFHQPNEGITRQIGSGQHIANATGFKVICDFRTQDVEYGGQGAPLVPIGDRFLFSDFDACINLGGFANISFERNNQRIAYDICPVNVVLNHYSQQLGFAYDSEGLLAAQGKLHTTVLNHLNQLDYYTDMPPKSLGIEWVQKHVLPSISQIENTKDILRTYTEHASFQIAKSIENTQTVLFTGGGVFNSFLMRRVQALSNAKIVIPDKVTIEYKEALIFAFLGWLRSENITNCLASVTGAKKDHSSGKIFTPN